MPDDYEVGYRKPPKYTRFKSGRSGNPKGRPKGQKNFKTELLEELQERIPVKENGHRRTVSKQRAMLKSITAKAVQGDPRAATLVANLVYRFLQDEEESLEVTDMTAEDLEILKNYEARVLGASKVRHRTRPKKEKQHD